MADVPWRPFTSAVHEAVTGARAAADERGHPLAGPEHLLLALFSAGGGARRVLSHVGVDAAPVRAALDRQRALPWDPARGPRPPARLSLEALSALGRALPHGEEHAAEAADTQHVLLGLWDGENAAWRLLDAAGVDGRALVDAVAGVPRAVRAGGASASRARAAAATPLALAPEPDTEAVEEAAPPLVGFSDRAEAVVFAAQTAGSAAGRVSPEHLLLGLVSAAPDVLVSLLGTPGTESLRERTLDHLHGPGRLGPYGARSAVDAIEVAVSEAVALGATLVEPGHLLLGLVLAAPDVVSAAVFDAPSLARRLRGRLAGG